MNRIARSAARCAGILCVWLALAGAAAAQNRAHPGLVHVGKGEWVTPAQALEKGYVRYRDRWVPKRLEKDMRNWEAQDAKDVGAGIPYKTKSKHYRITSYAPRYVVELDFKPFLDELFLTYSKIFREDFGLKSKAADSHFLKVYWGFERFQKEEGNDRGTPAFFRGDELVTFYEETDPGEFYNSIFHEGAHQFFNAMLPGADLPIWLDEALATYFEGFTYSRALQKITANPISPDRLECAKEEIEKARAAGASTRPEDLFMRFEGDAFSAEHYALAWSFVHYLVHREGGKHRQDFGKFLQEMNGAGTKPVAEVFELTTRKKLEDIAPGWIPHVTALSTVNPVEWVFLNVIGEDALGLANDDIAWSLAGVEIHSGEQFEKLWAERARDRALELRVVRRGGKGYAYSTAFVDVVVPAGSALELEVDAAAPRTPNLVD